MSYHLGNTLRRRSLGGFSEDATKAIQETPGYFMAWYSAKSIALVAAVATVTYLLGREVGRRGREDS